jgi:hypothetical protein
LLWGLSVHKLRALKRKFPCNFSRFWIYLAFCCWKDFHSILIVALLHFSNFSRVLKRLTLSPRVRTRVDCVVAGDSTADCVEVTKSRASLDRSCRGYAIDINDHRGRALASGLPSTTVHGGARLPPSARAHERSASCRRSLARGSGSPTRARSRTSSAETSLIPLSPKVPNRCDKLMGWIEANWEACTRIRLAHVDSQGRFNWPDVCRRRRISPISAAQKFPSQSH